MEYMLLIYENESVMDSRSEADMGTLMAGYQAFTNSLREAGLMKAGEPLQPTPSATTVRIRNGETMTTDGPFAETKEQLGGYYLIDCENLDQALEWAAKIPTAATGSIEVRPVMVFG